MSFTERFFLTEEVIEKSAALTGRLAYGGYVRSPDFGDLSYVDNLLPALAKYWRNSVHEGVSREVVKGFIDSALDNNDLVTAEYSMKFLE